MDEFNIIEDCLVQHGKENNRVYLMKIHSKVNIERLYTGIDDLVNNHSYTKIFAKVPERFYSFFLSKGFEQEACVPRLFNGNEDGFFISKFMSEDRKKHNEAEVQKVISIAKNKTANTNPLPKDYVISLASEKDAVGLCEIYKEVFETYPFPIHDPSYIKKTMKNNIVYFKCMDRNNNILSASSSELDEMGKNVEMTDFATPARNRGKNLSLYLLCAMEDEMLKRGFKTSYTIARSASIGMNSTFAKNSYIFAGTLINNTNICGQFENMNVWYKYLKD